MRARRNPHVQRLHLRHAPFAAAILANRVQPACPAASRTIHLKTHLSARLRHMPRPAAYGTNLRLARLHAASVTHIAHIQSGETQLLHRPAHRLGKANVDLIFQIGARLFLSCLLRGILAAEELAEQIAETRSSTARPRSTRASAKIKSAEIKMNIFRRSAVTCSLWRHSSRHVESKLVVHLPFLRVRQNV